MAGAPPRIGIDLVAEQQLAGLVAAPTALARTFTQREIAECQARGQDALAAFARRFAAKEALIKATGQAVGHFREIEIEYDDSGRPFARWSYLSDNGLAADLSLSSSPPFAVAVAIVYTVPPAPSPAESGSNVPPRR